MADRTGTMTQSAGVDRATATALFVSGSAAAGSAPLLAAIRAAGHLVVEVRFLDDGDGPWSSAHLPGLDRGCGLHPGDGACDARVTTDRDGIYFAAHIDLLLRARRIRELRLAGEFPASFRRLVGQFAALHGYRVAEAGEGDLAALARAADPAKAARPVTLAERVAPGRAALLLIDVQNDFCSPDGATGRTRQSMEMILAATGRIRRLLAAARGAGLFVVHVRAEYGPLYRHVGAPYRFPARGGREPAVWTESAADLRSADRFPQDQVEVCRPGSWGGAFVDGIEPLAGEAVVTKHRFSAFADTGLDLLLRARGIETVVVAGVTTNCCVETTSREAVMRDFYLVVASDCVAVKDHLKDLHDATLESLGLYFGLVRPSETLIDLWSQAEPAEAALGAAGAR